MGFVTRVVGVAGHDIADVDRSVSARSPRLEN